MIWLHPPVGESPTEAHACGGFRDGSAPQATVGKRLPALCDATNGAPLSVCGGIVGIPRKHTTQETEKALLQKKPAWMTGPVFHLPSSQTPEWKRPAQSPRTPSLGPGRDGPTWAQEVSLRGIQGPPPPQNTSRLAQALLGY